MARLPELRKMADEWGLKLISIRDLIAYRLKQRVISRKGVEVDMPTEYGHFRLIPFRQKSNGLEHIAIIKGDIKEGEPVLVRVHSSCATGDIFGSMRCDCGENNCTKALQMIEKRRKRCCCLFKPRRKRHRTNGKNESLQIARKWCGYCRS